MRTIPRNTSKVFAGVAAFIASVGTYAQGSWKLDARGAAGPIAQVSLPDSGSKRRSSFVVFEYIRRCDPMFSFVEISGARLGTPTGQSVLNGSKIGIIVNGKFHTWHAAMTKYDNGYEAAFGVTNELFDLS